MALDKKLISEINSKVNYLVAYLETNDIPYLEKKDRILEDFTWIMEKTMEKEEDISSSIYIQYYIYKLEQSGDLSI